MRWMIAYRNVQLLSFAITVFNDEWTGSETVLIFYNIHCAGKHGISSKIVPGDSVGILEVTYSGDLARAA